MGFVLVKACLKRAADCFRDGRFADAKTEFEEALTLDPACEQARQGIARAEEQIKGFRLRHLRGRALAAEKEKDYKIAEDLYREIISLDPNDERARTATEALGLAAREALRACLVRARASGDEGRFADARDEFQQALKLDPACEEAHQGIAKAGEQIKSARLRHLWSRAAETEAQGDFKTAVAVYHDIAGLDPDDKRAPEALAHALKELIRPFLERADACSKADRFADARDEFQQALQFDPACEHARKGIAKAEEQIRIMRLKHLWSSAREADAKEDFQTAARLYQDIIALDPGDLRARATAGALNLLGQTTVALRKPDYKEALRLAGDIVKTGPADCKAVEKARILLGLQWDFWYCLLVGLLLGAIVGMHAHANFLFYVHSGYNDLLAPAVAVATGLLFAFLVFIGGYRSCRITRLRKLRLF